MRSGFVLFDHRLDSALRISAGTDQILFGIVGFVLIQFLLGFGDIQLIVQGILLVRAGLFIGGGEPRDLGFVRFDGSLRLLQTRFYLLGLGAWYRWMLLGITHGRCKGEV